MRVSGANGGRVVGGFSGQRGEKVGGVEKVAEGRRLGSRAKTLFMCCVGLVIGRLKIGTLYGGLSRTDADAIW